VASFVYTPAKTALLNADIDFGAPNDIRALLVMTNTTADTEQDVANIADFTTLDEYDGSGYSRATLAGEVVNEDAANNRAEFDANDFNFGTTVAAGTRQAAGMVIYKHVTNDADAILLAYIDTGGFPVAGGGGAFNVTVNAEGLLQAT
jgi:hypothetical protein